MVRDQAMREVLRLVARNDGQWYWYQVDRALSGKKPNCVGPFFEEIDALAAEGLIQVRKNPTLDEHERYWITEKGRAALAEWNDA